ncbi:MAG: beta-glucosidase, partial [Phototrophicales bacterium]
MTELNWNFPDDFVWGAATASYQVEGACDEDGRGPSIWDTFSHTPGKVKNGDTGDVACDHYHRWREDIALMQQLNLAAYRFSIAWPRIFPQGRGSVNQKGLDWYSRLVDGLLEAGITPYVTLYHWDLPQALQDDGDGWLRRGIVDDYAAYVDVVSKALGDRVKSWITFNEPWVFTWLGYTIGIHAPGYGDMDVAKALLATHHTYLAHGRGVEILRANVPDAQIGITLNLFPIMPATDKPEDAAAAHRLDGHHNRWYLDPIYKGTYPDDMLTLYGDAVPHFTDDEMQQIQQPTDFLGINYYSRMVVSDSDEAPGLRVKFHKPDGIYTAMDWEVYPQGLYQILKRVYDDYAVSAMYVTENGAAFDDVVSADGHVHDERRQNFLANHYEVALRAIEDGVPLKGY